MRRLILPLVACTAGALLALAAAGGRADAHGPVPLADVVIGNGTVQLGVHPQGHLNVPGGTASSGSGTTYVGLRFIPRNADVLAPGCHCEGWGVANAAAPYSAYVNQNELGGAPQHMIVDSFSTTSTTAVSTVTVTDAAGNAAMRVTHDFHPAAATEKLYEITVTIDNISGAPIGDLRYRRVMDWDVEPTWFNEYVTIDGTSTESLLYSSDNGFASANPLGPRTPIAATGPPAGTFFTDSGPFDHGAVFDFGFGSLAAGASKSFKLYYGAAATESDALAATTAVGAKIWSLAQPNTADGKTLGKPNTFVFAFGGSTGPGAFSNVSVSVDEQTLPAGAKELPLAAIPAAAMPIFAGPLVAAPVGSTPVGSTPVGSTPVGSTPVGSTPVGSTPVGSTPVGSTPVGSTPVGSTPVGSTGLLGTPVGSTPLRFVLASSVPVDWPSITDGSALDGRQPQTFTLDDVLRDGIAGPRFSALTLAQTKLDATLLRGIRYSSILVGNVTLDRIAGAASWCTPACTTSELAATSVVGLDISGRMVASAPVGSTTVAEIQGGIAGTPVGSTPVGSTNVADSRLGDILLTALAAPDTVVDCNRIPCAAPSTKTLRDAAALTPSAIRPGATIADLAGAIGHVSINELVIAIVGRAGVAWESLPVDGLQQVAAGAPVAHYRLEFDVRCPAPLPVSANVLLPHGFAVKLGTSKVTYGSAPSQNLSDPATDGTTGATWSLPGDPCTGVSLPTQHVALAFHAIPGLRIGTLRASATVTGGSDTASASAQAPILVTQNWEPDESPAPQIAKDILYLGHIAAAGDQDRFRIPIPPAGTRTTFLLSHLGADLDLVVTKPEAQPVVSNPVGSTPVGSTPIEDRGLALNTASDALPPESLADIPVGSTPVGSTPVGSTSTNRGTRDELAEIVSAGESGFYEITISGYNGAHSDDAYVLRVKQRPPLQLPPCPPRTLPFAGEATTGTLPSSLPGSTKTLFLVLRRQLAGLYGAAETNALLASLDPSDPTSVAARPDVQGQTLQLDGDPNVRAALDAWNANPCSSPNALVAAINEAVARYRSQLPDLRYLVLLGTHEALPMGWVPDLVTLSGASDYARDLEFTTAGLTKGNASYAAAATGHILTDDVYTTLTRRPWLGRELYLPELAGGRLVESPADIRGQLAQFADANGVLDTTTAKSLATGYDFLTDGAARVQTALETLVGATNAASLISDVWTAGALDAAFTSNATPPNVAAVAAHYNHFQIQPAAYSTSADLVSTASVAIADDGTRRFAGRILFTVGCNAGQNVPDTLVAAPTTAQQAQLQDWTQSWARQRTAVYLANTSFGYGDTEAVALSEKLAALLADRLGYSTTMGEKLVEAKHEYFSQMGTYGVYDEKALTELTLYGLPHWRLGAASPPAAATPPDLRTDVVTGLKVATIQFGPTTFTPHHTGRGTFWSAPDGRTHVEHYRMVQPLLTRDVTAPGLTAHGVEMTALATTDVADVDPYLALPTVANRAHEPEPRTVESIYPANFVTVNHTRPLGQPRDTVAVIAGQSRPTEAASNRVIERLVTELEGEVYYSTSSDFTPPLLLESGSTLDAPGTSATLFSRVAGAPKVVSALYTQGGTDGWHYVRLGQTTGSEQWTATVTVTGPIHVLFQAGDSAGNWGYSTSKGFLFTSPPSGDTTPPAILVDSPLPGATYTLNSDVRARYACSDAGGVATCAGPVADGARIDTISIGEKSFTVDAADLRTNASSVTRTYDVDYAFAGFFSPVDNLPTLNEVKAGRAVPVKFSLAGNQGLAIFAPQYPKSQAVPCASGALVDGIEETVTAGGSSLSYDATTDRYVYVWKTDAAWTGCRQLVLKLADGTYRRANFRFR